MPKNDIKMSEKSHFGRFIYDPIKQGYLSYTAQRAAGITALRGCFGITFKTV